MKSKPIISAILLATAMMANAQDEKGAASSETSTTSEALSTARILGEIPDGTPPPPVAPKPRYEVAAKDILSVTTHEEGGRTITIRQIKPIGLPQPPAPVSPALGEREAQFAKQVEDYREEHPKSGLLFLGATVYRSKDSPPKTLVRYWPQGGKEVTFWTNADYSLIAGGINSFVDSTGDTHHLLIGWSTVEIDNMAELRSPDSDFPEIPEAAALSDGGADLHLVGDAAAIADLAPLQSLHELYNKELTTLRTAYEGRERARVEREEYLKANPPQPKDITLNFWRTETPAPEGKGASK